MTALPEVRNRINSVDLLRGIIMVIMALDHVRDFFHVTAMTKDPLDISTTTTALFFTRWITHYCAPVFTFLAGTSIYLAGLKKTKKQLSVFLFTRGFWLVLVEVVLITFALSFNPAYNIIFLQVIWAIGCSMMLMALIINLPFYLILNLGLIIFFGHNLFDVILRPASGSNNIFLQFFVTGSGNFYPLSSGLTIVFLYKVVPFTGIMILGYCTGTLFKAEVTSTFRQKALVLAGVAAILLFVIVRFINGYGDPVKWSMQSNGFKSFLSFMNTSKYPPSLLFCCMTIGPALILLAVMEKANSKLATFFITYGRVPFFYYILHFYLIHLLCLVVFYLTGHTNNQIADATSPFFFRPAQFGFSLPVVYAIWIFIVLLMYPLCKWYGNYKLTHRQWWLSYL